MECNLSVFALPQVVETQRFWIFLLQKDGGKHEANVFIDIFYQGICLTRKGGIWSERVI